ncbi:MAG: M90 family metallopeptidase [Halioglobus sp.]
MNWLPLPSRLRRDLLSRRLRGRRIPASVWLQVEKSEPLLARFGQRDRVRLRMLASEVVWRTYYYAARGIVLTPVMQATLATRIAVVIHGLEDPARDPSLHWLRNWRELIVYPAAFKPHRQATRPLGGHPPGLVDHVDPVELGETSYQGPLVISWREPRPLNPHAVPEQVLIHELAHKLDMLDGYSNGHPPLHAHMDHQRWHDTFEAAYLHLNQRLEGGHRPAINPYAATSPAEFFAVCSEYFFAAPGRLLDAYPAVYEQLALFYQQQPL